MFEEYALNEVAQVMFALEWKAPISITDLTNMAQPEF